jgi:hypothetical protein
MNAPRCAGLVALAALAACSSDHSLLTQKAPQPEGGGAADVATPLPESSTVVDTGASPPDVGPSDAAPAPWTLTWLNGLVDQPETRFCLVPVVDGGEAPAAAVPVPAAGSLAFGAQVVLRAWPGIDPATTDVHPYAVAGGAAGATCSDLLGRRDAGDAAGQRATSLPLIPAGTLGPPASYLAIAAGCAADPAVFPDAGRDPACGAIAGRSGPDLVLVRLSRTVLSTLIGLQGVHASRATPLATVDFVDVGTNTLLTSFGPLEFGQISPTEPPAYLTQFGLSHEATEFGLRVGAAGGGFPSTLLPLAPILAASGFDTSRTWASGNMTFVLLGALPGLEGGVPGAPFQVAAVLSSPPSRDAN